MYRVWVTVPIMYTGRERMKGDRWDGKGRQKSGEGKGWMDDIFWIRHCDRDEGPAWPQTPATSKTYVL